MGVAGASAVATIQAEQPQLAQVLAMRDTGLRLVTFDGDQTLYSDGSDFSDPKLARYLVLLLHSGVSVALVTAAGYGYEGALCDAEVRLCDVGDAAEEQV